MNTEKFDKFIIVSGVKTFDEIRSAAESEQNIFAVVINAENEFKISESDRDYLRNCGFVSVLYSSDMSAFSADFIMQFDIRLSDMEYFITADLLKELDINRYALLCGMNDTFKLVSNFSGRKTSDYKTKLVRVTEGTDGVKDFCTSLFKEKTDAEITCILECLTAARTGDNSKVFAAESKNFYRMVSQKAEVR